MTQIQPFGPETLETWELGLKTDLFDRLLRFNAAAFTSKYNDIPADPKPLPPIQPAARAAHGSVPLRTSRKRWQRRHQGRGGRGEYPPC